LSGQCVIHRAIRVAAGRFAPGHLGELTQIIPFEMVDAVLASTRRVETRVRDLPSRVVVYLLLAGALFAELGYRQVWARMVAGLDGLPVAFPGSSGLAKARARVGVAPLKALFDLLAGPAAGAARWRGMLVCAIDGTSMFVPDSAANLAAYGRQTGSHGGSGYPMMRLLAVVACGTRTLIDVAFGPYRIGETSYAPTLTGRLSRGVLLLADRNFAVIDLAEQIHATGANLLIRCKNGRRLPDRQRLADGSWLSMFGTVPIRVIDADIIVTVAGHRTHARYRLVTSLLDPRRFPAHDLIELYHQRWEIETTYLHLKATMLGGRVLRARTPHGITQEVYALLAAYQALRLAMADATASQPGLPAHRASFTVALNAARDQVIHAAAVIAATTIDLVGKIGHAVLADLLPPRRDRRCPHVVKRAISKHRAKGETDRHNHKTTIHIKILGKEDLTPSPDP